MQGMTPDEALSNEHTPSAADIGNTVRFTVAIVCLNAEAHIGEALESVAEQSGADFELLVIDGGSTDSTLRIVDSYVARMPGALRVVSEPDEGLFDAMNKALAAAAGEYIVYLGADDRMAAGALAAVEAGLGEAAADIVCGGTRVIGEGGGWTEEPELVLRRGLPRSAPTRHQSIYVRTALVRRIGGFDTRYRIAADYDVYLRMWKAGATERFLGRVLSEFRLGGVSSSSALATAREYRDIRIAHGAAPLVERIAAYKSALGVVLFALRHRTLGTPGRGGE